MTGSKFSPAGAAPEEPPCPIAGPQLGKHLTRKIVGHSWKHIFFVARTIHNYFEYCDQLPSGKFGTLQLATKADAAESP